MAVHVSMSSICSPAFIMSTIISTISVLPSVDIREKKKKCCPYGDCRYRMKPTDTLMVCRCGTSYCPTHRLPEQHACTFDFRSTASTHLRNQLVKCAGERLVDKLE